MSHNFVLPEDCKEIADDVLDHRILLNYEAEANNVTTHQIIRSLLEKVVISS